MGILYPIFLDLYILYIGYYNLPAGLWVIYVYINICTYHMYVYEYLYFCFTMWNSEFPTFELYLDFVPRSVFLLSCMYIFFYKVEFEFATF